MPDTALLPCPFCGGKASLAEGRNGDGTPFTYIECEKCRAMAELEWWNKRVEARHATYVAWARYSNGMIGLCDSDSPGAFRVYRHPKSLELARA